ncbi:hypothetical protein EFW58_00002 [Bacillus velezensis]|nr:hypothetical protein EFW58_00002 [Bacillus velezensis]
MMVQLYTIWERASSGSSLFFIFIFPVTKLNRKKTKSTRIVGLTP